MNIDFISISRFTSPDRRSYVPSCHSIGVSFRGFRYVEMHGAKLPSLPCVVATTAGLPISFDCGDDRENIICLFHSPDWRASRTQGQIEIRGGDEWLRLPIFTPIGVEEARRWRYELGIMGTLVSSPLPVDRFRLRTRFMQLLCGLIGAGVGSKATSPAGRLREMIDQDDGFLEPLQTLSARCGYSPGYLRSAFNAEFGLTPKAYQQQRRIAHAMVLVTNSSTSVKEIAAACGYRHVSHFSTAFRQAYGMTASRAIARYRS